MLVLKIANARRFSYSPSYTNIGVHDGVFGTTQIIFEENILYSDVIFWCLVRKYQKRKKTYLIQGRKSLSLQPF